MVRGWGALLLAVHVKPPVTRGLDCWQQLVETDSHLRHVTEMCVCAATIAAAPAGVRVPSSCLELKSAYIERVATTYISMMAAVCRTLPTYTIAWYLAVIVVGWCKITTSASNSQVAANSSVGESNTMPFLICDRLIFLSANEAVCPPFTVGAGVRRR